MIKKILTSCESEVYAESLKTSYKRLSHPSDLRFFCNLIGLSRAGNILNTSQSFLVTAFSEATHLTQFCVGFSKKKVTRYDKYNYKFPLFSISAIRGRFRR